MIDELAQKEGAEFRLHPLIHTRQEFTLTQCIESCQGSVGEKNKSPTDQFFIAHRNSGDVGKVMKGIIGAPDKSLGLRDRL